MTDLPTLTQSSSGQREIRLPFRAAIHHAGAPMEEQGGEVGRGQKVRPRESSEEQKDEGLIRLYNFYVPLSFFIWWLLQATADLFLSCFLFFNKASKQD